MVATDHNKPLLCRYCLYIGTEKAPSGCTGRDVQYGGRNMESRIEDQLASNNLAAPDFVLNMCDMGPLCELVRRHASLLISAVLCRRALHVHVHVHVQRARARARAHACTARLQDSIGGDAAQLQWSPCGRGYSYLLRAGYGPRCQQKGLRHATISTLHVAHATAQGTGPSLKP